VKIDLKRRNMTVFRRLNDELYVARAINEFEDGVWGVALMFEDRAPKLSESDGKPISPRLYRFAWLFASADGKQFSELESEIFEIVNRHCVRIKKAFEAKLPIVGGVRDSDMLTGKEESIYILHEGSQLEIKGGDLIPRAIAIMAVILCGQNSFQSGVGIDASEKFELVKCD
jgi:hypothetical protein